MGEGCGTTANVRGTFVSPSTFESCSNSMQSTVPEKPRSAFHTEGLFIDCDEFSFSAEAIRQQLQDLDELFVGLEGRVHRKLRRDHRLLRLRADLKQSVLAFESAGRQGSLHFHSFMEMRIHLKLLREARPILVDWDRYAHDCLDPEYYDHFFFTLATRQAFILWKLDSQIVPEVSERRTPDLTVTIVGQELGVEVKTKRKLVDPEASISSSDADKIVAQAFKRVGSSRTGQIRDRLSMVAICGYFCKGDSAENLTGAVSRYFERMKSRPRVAGVVIVNLALRLKWPQFTVVNPINLIISTDAYLIANPYQESNVFFIRLENEPILPIPNEFRRWSADKPVQSSGRRYIVTNGHVSVRPGAVFLAKTALEEAVSAGKADSEVRALALALRRAADAEILQGEPVNARWAYERLLEIDRTFDDEREEAKDLNGLGTALRLEGSAEEAVRVFRKAFVLTAKTKDTATKAFILNNLGNVWLQSGRLGRALLLYRRALRLNEEVQNEREVGTNLGNIGTVYQKMEQGDDARTHFKQALAVCERLQWWHGIGENLIRLASLEEEYSNFKDARQYIALARAVFLNNKSSKYVADSFYLEANICSKEQKFDEARLYYNNALRLYATTGPRSQIEIVSELLAQLPRLAEGVA